MILVTGAAGFIGSHLSENLLRYGHDVIGLDNFNDFYNPALKRQNLASIQETAKKEGKFFQCYSGDICDEDMVNTLLAEHKIQTIIHLAAMAGVRPSIQKPLLYERVNGLGTLTILECAQKNNVKKIIFGSSSSVYGLNKKIPFSEKDPVNLPYSPYASTKRAGELACFTYHQLYQISFAVLRFFTVYGPRQRPDLAIRKFTELIFKNKPICIYGDGHYQRDFTYIDDIIDGIIKSMTWLNQADKPQYEIFNLGESATTSVNNLIKLLEKHIGQKAIKEYKLKEPGDVPQTYANITKAKTMIGYKPKTPLEKGIPLFIEWYRDHLKKE
ncbi:MAG: epimerase [Deltaproteobacteria bacterium RIFCSPLOWO2_12_FULL_40_28]|nr:MAG: epimerase [Deltaproteobacteria bacterium RIFCSPHIGHO2_02_FULL_40_28]OGQ20122.1 MAG: epimerase [Deltaproteobacteria bacterium RIFCSPHIGHO2_12_FULL_40_32]OGQ40693.1 MAG: epimerase [Deltaproteobacteria bacterium RIFCSPLOWO2_02_FULL_40_36]OGQ54389.1 MAG: epimerase [Deltaproteobacteria bacterium RIFCSPLOWO2_12_FULL_40_28]